jgi:hypothetical protein
MRKYPAGRHGCKRAWVFEYGQNEVHRRRCRAVHGVLMMGDVVEVAGRLA